MPFDPILSSEYQPDKPVVGVGGFGEKVAKNLGYLNSLVGSLTNSDVPNGGFELDSDGDGVPDSWTWSAYAGGTISIGTTTPLHGGAYVKIVHPGGTGNGGGYIHSDYMPCSEFSPEIIHVLWRANVPTMRNKIAIRWYDAAKVYLRETPVYNNAANNPTSGTPMFFGALPPSSARFFRVALYGGIDNVDQAGTTYFDYVTRLPNPLSLVYPAQVGANISLAQQPISYDFWTTMLTFTTNIGTNLPCRIAVSPVAKTTYRVYPVEARLVVDGVAGTSTVWSEEEFIEKEVGFDLNDVTALGTDCEVTVSLQAKTTDAFHSGIIRVDWQRPTRAIHELRFPYEPQ